MGSGYGFLLLTSHLGNPQRKPLTTAQLRVLTQRIRWGQNQGQDGELEEHTLMGLGYDRETAVHIKNLLEEQALLDHYLFKARSRKCVPITRQDPAYPLIVRKRLGLDSPGCLWLKGDAEILKKPGIALVGSRDLQDRNRDFAAQAGEQAARQGFVLVSGNARGADQVAQDACLSAGGQVICVVADALHSQPERENVLFISEEDYDAPFSTMRALRRNRVIHALGWMTIVAQCQYRKGGTWNGTTQNLQYGWNRVFCFDDGSSGARELEQLGVRLIDTDGLLDYGALSEQDKGLFDE